MEDSVFLSLHPKAWWSCAKRKQKRGENEQFLPGTKAKIYFLPWPKSRKRTRCYPSGQLCGDKGLLPVEGTKPGWLSVQHKSQLTCSVMHISTGQFTEFTIFSEKKYSNIHLNPVLIFKSKQCSGRTKGTFLVQVLGKLSQINGSRKNLIPQL